MSLTKVINASDNSWIDGFEAVVSDVTPRQTKTGKTFWNAALSDEEGNQISGTFWIDPNGYAGQLCSFKGQGMKKTSYQGNAQVSVGDKVNVLPLAKEVKAHTSAQGLPAASAPNGSAPAPVRAAASTPKGKSAIFGATAGMGVNNAWDLIKTCYSPEEIKEAADTGKLTRYLAEYAGAFVKVSLFIEAGNVDGYAPETVTETTEEEDDLPF